MTIQVFCPSCKEVIEFDSEDCGKRAQCSTCGQFLIVPSRSFETPEKVEPELEKRTQPLPGFYRAVFVDSWKLFINPENVTSLVFVAAVICFKFFLARAVCCMNYITFVVVWGWLLGFYLNIIYQTAVGTEQLPEIYLGTGLAFLWYIVKPFLIFFFTMTIVQLPFIITLGLLRHKGPVSENIWQAPTALDLLLQMLFILGLFFFPAAILTTAVGKDIALLRPDYILAPIFRAFKPYLVAVAVLVAFGILEMHTEQFRSLAEETFLSAAGKLTFNLAAQIIAIIAMRSIGLFYRHYSCHLPW